MKRFAKPSYLAAAGLALATLIWIFTGDMDQAARHYGLDADMPAAKSAQAATPAEAPEKAPTAVRVRRLEAVERGRDIAVTGVTDVIHDAEVTAETSGRVVEIAAAKGAWLDKGAVILKLAMDDRQARLREAEAKVEYERIGFEAAKKLTTKGFQSEVKLAQEKSELEQAKAALEAIRLDIERTTVRAPIAGYLDTLPVGVGDYLKSGDKIVLMINPDPIRVVAQVSEQYIGNLSKGDPAVARALGGREFTGAVRYMAQRADAATRTFRVDIWVDNKDHALRDGQTMEIILKAGHEKAHRVSPAVLTLNEAGAVGVKTVDADNRVRFRPIRIIAHTPEGIWLGGLPDSMTLITVGQEFVAEGQKVMPVAEDAVTAAEPAGK